MKKMTPWHLRPGMRSWQPMSFRWGFSWMGGRQRPKPTWQKKCAPVPGGTDPSWSAPLQTACPPLADATANYTQARTFGECALAVRRSLKRDTASLYFDERVLFFLYLRDNAELQPLCDRHSPLLYRYPMVDALARDGEDAAGCLATLTRRRLLEPALLVDRTRHCRSCASAHLHFLDVCPHCSSIHIGKAASLHCFSCGQVGPERDFHDNGALVCPKCSASLRHIGVDYDRPLTQYACGSCHHVFMETSVIARCLDCGTAAEPDALDMREIATLRLAPQGRAALRAGQIQESFAALDTANYVPPPIFAACSTGRWPRTHAILKCASP